MFELHKPTGSMFLLPLVFILSSCGEDLTKEKKRVTNFVNILHKVSSYSLGSSAHLAEMAERIMRNPIPSLFSQVPGLTSAAEQFKALHAEVTKEKLSALSAADNDSKESISKKEEQLRVYRDRFVKAIRMALDCEKQIHLDSIRVLGEENAKAGKSVENIRNYERLLTELYSV